LYAGIGGFRLGFEREGHECVWSCEIDKYCRQVYRHQFGETPTGDVREVDPESIPDFELLCAGFPCQSFSLAGERRGFEDTRGTLFHEICRVLRVRRPPHYLLENVEGLLSTQEREAFRVVLQSLDGLGYDAEWQVLNSKNFGVPQNRPRVFITGHLRGEPRPEVLPVARGEGRADGTRKEAQEEGPRVRGEGGGEANALQVGGEGLERNLVANTISRRYHKDGSENLVIHNIYGGFNEGIREFEDESPAIRTPKGGGHIPSVVESRKGKFRVHRNDEKKSEIQGYSLFDEGTDFVEESHGHQPKVLMDYGFQKSAYSPSGISPTVREGHGDVVRIAERFGPKQSGGIYSKDGISPTVSWGKREPFPHHISEFKLMPHAKTKLPFMGSAPKPKGEGEISFPLASSGAYKLAKRVGKSTREAERDGDEDIYAGYVDIRKLTPVECERLQGFPDGWTERGLTEGGEEVEISDTQRYKMLGNAITVNVVEFLARRYRQFEEEKL